MTGLRGGGAGPPHSVDGVFQIGAGIEPPPNEMRSNALIQAAANGEESDEEDLTYNSQGKPIPRSRAHGDKK